MNRVQHYERVTARADQRGSAATKHETMFCCAWAVKASQSRPASKKPGDPLIPAVLRRLWHQGPSLCRSGRPSGAHCSKTRTQGMRQCKKLASASISRVSSTSLAVEVPLPSPVQSSPSNRTRTFGAGSLVDDLDIVIRIHHQDTVPHSEKWSLSHAPQSEGGF